MSSASAGPHCFVGLRAVLLLEMGGCWWKWIIELVKLFLEIERMINRINRERMTQTCLQFMCVSGGGSKGATGLGGLSERIVSLGFSPVMHETAQRVMLPTQLPFLSLLW